MRIIVRSYVCYLNFYHTQPTREEASRYPPPPSSFFPRANLERKAKLTVPHGQNTKGFAKLHIFRPISLKINTGMLLVR
jgi:hypothetical protein